MFRTRTIIEEVKRKRDVNQRFPINPEMLGKGEAQLNMSTPTGGELWGAMMTGFHFALRIGEVQKLGDRDIPVGKLGGKPRITIHTRWSKTDQRKLCVHRALVMAGWALCPVQCIAQWLDMKTWRPLASAEIFYHNDFGKCQ